MDCVHGVWLFFAKSTKINSGNDAVNLRVSYVSKDFFKILETGNLLKEIPLLFLFCPFWISLHNLSSNN